MTIYDFELEDNQERKSLYGISPAKPCSSSIRRRAADLRRSTRRWKNCIGDTRTMDSKSSTFPVISS